MYFIHDNCILCDACEQVCPVNAISYIEGDSQYRINEECIDCGACDQVCPVNAIAFLKEEIDKKKNH